MFRNHPGYGEEVEELVQAPDPCLLRVHGRAAEVGDKVGQQAVIELLLRVHRLTINKGPEFPETDLQGLPGSGSETGDFTIVEEFGSVLFEHRGTSFGKWLTSRKGFLMLISEITQPRISRTLGCSLRGFRVSQQTQCNQKVAYCYVLPYGDLKELI